MDCPMDTLADFFLFLSSPPFETNKINACFLGKRGTITRGTEPLFIFTPRPLTLSSGQFLLPVFSIGRKISHRIRPLFVILIPWLSTRKFWISGYGLPKAYSCRFLSLSWLPVWNKQRSIACLCWKRDKIFDRTEPLFIFASWLLTLKPRNK